MVPEEIPCGLNVGGVPCRGPGRPLDPDVRVPLMEQDGTIAEWVWIFQCGDCEGYFAVRGEP